MMAPLSIQNLLNNQWRQTQLFYESRLEPIRPRWQYSFHPRHAPHGDGWGSLVFLTDEPEPTKSGEAVRTDLTS